MTRSTRNLVLATGALSTALLAGAHARPTAPALHGAGIVPGDGPAPELGTFETKDRPSRSFDVDLPAERWRSLGDRVPIAHAGGDGFPVLPEGTGLRLDTDGDGEPDRSLEGIEDEATGVQHAFVVLTGQRVDGGELRYGVRLRDAGKGWEWAASGSCRVKVGDTRLELIDQDGDGRFDEVGVDALIVGGGDVATFLSDTVHVDGHLCTLEVARDGRSVTLSEYTGERGTLDLTAELETDGRLLSAVVKSVDGRHSFDLALHEDGLEVPAGDYRLVRGQLALGDARVGVREGRAKPAEVPAGGTTRMAWGGPARAEFAYHRNGAQLEIRPDEVWYYGTAGEQYDGWDPVGKSPTFTVKEKDTGEVLVDFVFPGSC